MRLADETGNQGDNTESLKTVAESALVFDQQVHSAKSKAPSETTGDENTKIAELEQRSAELNIKVLEQSETILTLMHENKELVKQNEKLKQENQSKDQLNEELQQQVQDLTDKLFPDDSKLADIMRENLRLINENSRLSSRIATELDHKSSSPVLGLMLTSTSTSALSRFITRSSPARTSAPNPSPRLVFSRRSDQPHPSPTKKAEFESLKDKPRELPSVTTSPSHARSIDGNDQVSNDLPATPADSHSPKSSKQDSHFSSRSPEGSKRLENPQNKITSGSESKDFNLIIQRDEKKQRSSIKSAGITFEMSTAKEIEITRVENCSNPDDIDKEMAKNLYNYFAKQSSDFFERPFKSAEFINHFSSQGIKVKGDIETDHKGFIKHFKKINNKHLKSTKPTSARSLKFGEDVKQRSSGGSSR